MIRKTTNRSQKLTSATRRDDSFEAVAARLECDPDMDKFLKNLGKIAKAKVDHGGQDAKRRNKGKG